MAIIETATPKTAKSRVKKGPKAKTDTKAGDEPAPPKDTRFKPGNKAAEKWPEDKVLEKLEAIWKTLTTSSKGKAPANGDITKANDIKLLGQVCLIHGVTKQRWNEWEDKFSEFLKSEEGAPQQPNPNYSEAVTDLIKNIKWLLECRLIHSGRTMDIVVLNRHYDYYIRRNIDHTTKGKEISNPFYDFLKQSSLK